MTRFLASFLFGVKPDPVAFVVTPLFLSAVALCAVWIPARRATRVDPMTALRLEVDSEDPRRLWELAAGNDKAESGSG